ncbi:hypothetical protein PTSG_13122 [Salpingoeca rosetta]|uniref:phosphopyruvate hydratase n=1 Tax=Salpingoeca rosetta (strain ATCC 50818 / BSB-021) TaxID=946362 RepID=F2URE8_SALR5|nr:uncharacterized protein PTSG_13122 [Salpingoeca rosetta]EGD80251.1 hypothetical protein PTSG_13122 [Salpingoeca rosetta]|eukprot:XP_004988313.1 hypothetical protein PTSG_13122 [Salpingoeca rosetta]
MTTHTPDRKAATSYHHNITTNEYVVHLAGDLDAITSDLRQAFRTLGAPVPTHEIVKMAQLLLAATSGPNRTYHSTQHVYDTARLDEERDVVTFLAALFQDIVYLQLDECIAPFLLPILRRSRLFSLPLDSVTHSASTGRRPSDKKELNAEGLTTPDDASSSAASTSSNHQGTLLTDDELVQYIEDSPCLVGSTSKALTHRSGELSHPSHIVLMAGKDLADSWGFVTAVSNNDDDDKRAKTAKCNANRDCELGLEQVCSGEDTAKTQDSRCSSNSKYSSNSNSSSSSSSENSSSSYSNSSSKYKIDGRRSNGTSIDNGNNAIPRHKCRRTLVPVSAAEQDLISRRLAAIDTWWMTRKPCARKSGGHGGEVEDAEAEQEACVLSESSVAARRMLGQQLCYRVFGFVPGEVLPFDIGTRGMNEFLSCVVAMDMLAPWLDDVQLLHVCACIKATVHFGGRSSITTLYERCAEAMSTDLQLDVLWTSRDIHESTRYIVECACNVAARDVSNMAARDTRVFLANTWRLLPEQHAQLRSRMTFTLTEWMGAMLHQLTFFQHLETKPFLIFPRFAQCRSREEQQRLEESAVRNLRRGAAYVACRLVTASIMHAVLARGHLAKDSTPLFAFLPNGMGGPVPAELMDLHDREGDEEEEEEQHGHDTFGLGTTPPPSRPSSRRQHVARGFDCVDDDGCTPWHEYTEALLMHGFDDLGGADCDVSACEASLMVFRSILRECDGGGDTREVKGGRRDAGAAAGAGFDGSSDNKACFAQCVRASVAYYEGKLDLYAFLRQMPRSAVDAMTLFVCGVCSYFRKRAHDPVISELLQRPAVSACGKEDAIGVTLKCHVHCASRNLATVLHTPEKSLSGLSLRRLVAVEAALSEHKTPATSAVSLLCLRSLASFEHTSIFSQAAKFRADPHSPTRLPTPMCLAFAPALAPGKLKIRRVYVRCPRLFPALKAHRTLAELERHLRQHITRSKTGALTANYTDSGHLAPTFDKLDQALDAVREASKAAGLTLGTDVFMVLDIGAHVLFEHNKGKYEITQGGLKTPQDWCDELLSIVHNENNGIAMVIDPFRPQDEMWKTFAEGVKDSHVDICSAVGDDLDVSDDACSNALTARVYTPPPTHPISVHMETVGAWSMQNLNAVLAHDTPALDNDNPDTVDIAAAMRAPFMTCLLPSRHPRTHDRLLALERELKDMGVWAPASRINASADRRLSARPNTTSSDGDGDGSDKTRLPTLADGDEGDGGDDGAPPAAVRPKPKRH